MIGFSNFAIKQHHPDAGNSYFTGTDEELFQLISDNWDKRIVGTGAKSVDDVCIVHVPPDKFISGTVAINYSSTFYAHLHKRQSNEQAYIRVMSTGPRVKAKFASVVLYSARELLKNNGERSGDYDWEIVCLIASPVEKEPMRPLAMARNQLEKTGGTPRKYTSEEWAEAVWYWSQYTSPMSAKDKWREEIIQWMKEHRNDFPSYKDALNIERIWLADQMTQKAIAAIGNPFNINTNAEEDSDMAELTNDAFNVFGW